MVFTLNARDSAALGSALRRRSGAMDPSRGVQRPHDGDIDWLREASTTALGTDASSPSAFKGLPASFLAVFITIGDKTFFLAMLLAMRHGKLAVFLATVAAMFFMTLGSTFAGYLISTSAASLEASVQWMDFVAGALFIAFAAQLLRDAHRLHAKDREDEEVRALLGGDSGDSAQHGELLDAEETLQEVEQKEGGKVGTWWGGVPDVLLDVRRRVGGQVNVRGGGARRAARAAGRDMRRDVRARARELRRGVRRRDARERRLREVHGGHGSVVFLLFGAASLYEGITRQRVPFA